jgi:hypothetical protein
MPDLSEEVSRNSALYRSLPPFQSPTEIRVLDLAALGPDSSSNTPIEVVLRIIDLDHNVPFTALSYVWGDYAIPRDIMYCNDIPIELTRNCWSALWHLRKIFGAVPIWVDAVCINQSDELEKSFQIPLMEKIYSSADQVYIWLGNGTPSTNTAMDYLGQGALGFNTLITRTFPGGVSRTGVIPTGRSMAKQLAIDLYIRMITFRLRPHNAGLKDILGRQWIKRLWTLQEAVLSNHLVVVCGERFIPWRAMVFSLEFMEFCRVNLLPLQFPDDARHWQGLLQLWKRHHGYAAGYASHPITLPASSETNGPLEEELIRHRGSLKQGWEWFRSGLALYDGVMWRFNLIVPPVLIVYTCSAWLRAIRAVVLFLSITSPIYALNGILNWAAAFFAMYQSYNDTHERSIIYPHSYSESLLMEVCRRSSMEVKDKYYAILGIIQGSQTTETLTADTNLDVIYSAMIIDLLRHTGDMNILLFASRARIRQSPSWVIDWRVARPFWVAALFRLEPILTERFWKIRIHDYNTELQAVRYPGATLQSQSRWKIDYDEKSTQPERLVVLGDIPSRISYSSGEIEEISLSSTQEKLRHSVEVFTKYLIGFATPNLLLSNMEALSAIIPYKDHRGRQEWCNIMHQGLSKGSAWSVQQLELPDRGVQWARFFSWISLQRPHLTTALGFHLALINGLSRGKLALVCSSLESGVAPMDTEVGDAVALISGVSLPMILRLRKSGKAGYEVIGPSLFPTVMFGTYWEVGHIRDEIVLV